ncbi:MAG: c-type cytochrome [Longimicrobiales bacterium]
MRQRLSYALRCGMAVFAVAACLLFVISGHAASQQGDDTPKRSTLSGVFTQAQAARGRDTYGGMCRSCHTPESHAAPAFLNTWSGRPLWDLFLYVSGDMPKSDPGSLAPNEYAQVLAYLLEMNGMPAGKDELPTDSLILKKIRFDTVSTR